MFSGEKCTIMWCILYWIKFANMQLHAKTTYCRENSKYASDKYFCDHFCFRRKAAKFCHPGPGRTAPSAAHRYAIFFLFSGCWNIAYGGDPLYMGVNCFGHYCGQVWLFLPNIFGKMYFLYRVSQKKLPFWNFSWTNPYDILGLVRTSWTTNWDHLKPLKTTYHLPTIT